MATEVIDIKIQDAQAAGSIKDLRKSLKGLVDELSNVPSGSKEFKKLSNAINDTEGKIGDLTDSFSTLKGSGIERTNASMGLLREGFQNFDTDKIKAGLNGVGAAFKAIPIFLVVQGIQYLVENFKELSSGSGLLAKALQFVGDILTAIGDGITWLTDNIGLTNSALEAMGEKAVEMAEKSKDALAAQSAEYDRLAKEAVLAGKSAIKYEIAKQQAIIDTNTAVLNQLLLAIKAGKELSEEESKLLTSGTAALKMATTERKVLLAKLKDEEIANNKEAYDKWLALEQKKIDDRYAAWKAKQDAAKEEADSELAAENYLASLKLEAKKEEYDAAGALQAEALDRSTQAAVKAADKQKEIDKNVVSAKKQVEDNYFNAAKALSDTFFITQLNRAKGNEKAELEIKKRMFQTDKAFSVARAIQDGIRSVQGALAQTATLGPFAQVLAISNGVLAAANVAKILATKFDSSGGGGGSSDVSGGGGNVPNINTPNNTTAPTTQSSTTFDQNGRNQNLTITANVFEGEMTSKQKRAAKIDGMATI